MVSNVETNPRGVDVSALHTLMSDAFAYMAPRIDPPSSMTRLDLLGVARKMASEDLFVIHDGATPVACLFGSIAYDHYYVGKLAVAERHRGRGLARALMEVAADHARVLGAPVLRLQSRVELVENHSAFGALGFVQTGDTAHAGYDRPTSLTFERML